MSSLDPTRLLLTIETIHQSFVDDRDDTARLEVLEVALRAALELTDSALGFIARVSSGPNGPVLAPECELALDPKRHGKIIAWLRQTLESSAQGATIPRPLANLVRATEPLVLSYEPRLPALDNFMAIPLSRHGRRWQPIAVFALANRAGGFSAELAAALRPLLAACNTVLKAYEDAAQRSARELEFERSEQRFRTFMDASPCIAYITDDQRNLVWASRAFGQQFGVNPEEAIGRHEDELLPGGMAARTSEISEQARVSDGAVDMLEPIVDSGGVLHWWQGAKFPIDGEGGERLVGSLALDVSDSVRMTEVLREREAVLAEAQELARLARWTWVLEKDKLSWDPQFERMTGVSNRHDHGIEDLYALIHPEDVDSTRRALEELQQNIDTRLTIEHRILARGQVIDLFIVAQIRDEIEDGQTVIAVVQDVSDRRRLERSRRELESQARKFESLSILSGGMAAQFNSLLVGILGNAGIALDDLDLDSLAAACIQDIEASAERAAVLTQQLLTLSGRVRFTREELELGSVIAAFAERLHASISETVTMRLALHADLPSVLIDREQLRQLVTNLAVNGSEAIGESEGELTLETGVIDLDAAALASFVVAPPAGPGRYVWLEVRDTGAGVDRETCARIFEPFFSTKEAGRGLGLTAALAVIRAHEGGIEVESSPGSGARFRVLLPIASGLRLDRHNESWSRVFS